MRVLIVHGYLLRGTGSNVYNAYLAGELVRLGHEVHLVCQERAPEQLPFVDRVGTWRDSRLELRTLREPVRCTVYRPEIGRLLPVYVADRYAGVEARPFADVDDGELAAYVDANVRAVREVAARARPEAALANHLVIAPLVLARALRGSGVPYAVKVHGSALEYTVKPDPARFLPLAREGLTSARGVLVGSGHVARSLWAALGEPELADRTRLGPPGVDVARFSPRGPPAARAGLRALAERVAGEPPPARLAGDADSAFARDATAAAGALRTLADGAGRGDRLVVYVGKLIVAKGVDLLLAAWPLVLARAPDARLAIVGFGAYRSGLERLAATLAAGDLAGARELAAAGRELEGGPPGELRHLAAFLEGLDRTRGEDYRAAATKLAGRVSFTGRLEHAELAELLPACEAQVVPSTFPEAFGMVAAEAAACGVLPVSAAHSGLAEVSGALASAVPAPASEWLSFGLDADVVPALARRLTGWLTAPAELRERTRAALVEVARERWSWEGVARGVLAAARGELAGLERVRYEPGSDSRPGRALG